MTRRQWLASCGVAVGMPTGWADPAGFAMIVHPSNQYTKLNRSKVHILYAKKISRWPWGAEAEPLDLPERTPARAWFVKQVLKSSEPALAEYWIEQRTSSGVAPPKQAVGAGEVVKFVASRHGAIGYVPLAEVNASVKVLTVE
jgi:ABC-type phosphate transport system substrate-binding protein